MQFFLQKLRQSDGNRREKERKPIQLIFIIPVDRKKTKQTKISGLHFHNFSFLCCHYYFSSTSMGLSIFIQCPLFKWHDAALQPNSCFDSNDKKAKRRIPRRNAGIKKIMFHDVLIALNGHWKAIFFLLQKIASLNKHCKS